MNKRNGYTIIEIMIVIAIIGIIVAVVAPHFTNPNTATEEVKQSQCIEGVKFTVPSEWGGTPEQIIGPDGSGISCDTVTEDTISNENTWSY